MNRQPLPWHPAVLSAFVAAALLTTGQTATVPTFELPRWQTGEPVRLDDFAGQILVLDFFAYWCAPCEPASKEIENGVRQFYATRRGNPHGVPVRVLSVNIESDFPERTAAFVQQTGMSFVVNDFSGTLLKQLGGEGIPFLVIVDGTRSQPGAPRFEVVYRHAGFEGLRRIRQIIDRLGSDAATPKPPRSISSPAPEPGPGAPWAHGLGVDAEFVWASDIMLSDSRFSYRLEKGGTELELAFAYATFDIEYQPFTPIDFFGFNEDLHEDRFTGQASLRQRLAQTFTLLAGGGIYDGYSDYRRVWIANRYRQKYDHPDFPRVPGYETPDPKGYNLSIGTRYEYLPAIGFAELKLGYAHDQTAPGYEDSLDTNGQFVLLQGRERLDTKSVALTLENVLSKRLRALNEFGVSDTTGREPRFTYQGSLNLALAERWVLRGYGGLSTEAPQFDGHFFGLTAEYEAAPNLLLSLSGRYYRDSGEIENSLPVTSAAPPLRSWEAGVGFRYTWSRASLKLQAGPVWTDYMPQPGIAEEFTYLYSDRNWVLVQLAFSVQL
ncbi:MAG TPA: TlpA disulfide reductase family protein [Verrucomicrobiae bacterium]|nr:TlpA disulfide reductase family protein [Verrucomicrobiae bacterium]